MIRGERLTAILWAAGVVTVVAAALTGRPLATASGTTTKPFLVVGGVVLAGWLGVQLGVFDRLERGLRSASVPRGVVVVAVLGWAAVLSGVVNLDVAVVVVMPLALVVAPTIGVEAAIFAMGVAGIANASSILLPTSNLTTLLVLGPDPRFGSFLRASRVGSSAPRRSAACSPRWRTTSPRRPWSSRAPPVCGRPSLRWRSGRTCWSADPWRP